MVADQGEMPLELDDAGQLAALIEGSADGFGSFFIDGEHKDILRSGKATVEEIPSEEDGGTRPLGVTASIVGQSFIRC